MSNMIDADTLLNSLVDIGNAIHEDRRTAEGNEAKIFFRGELSGLQYAVQEIENMIR